MRESSLSAVPFGLYTALVHRGGVNVNASQFALLAPVFLKTDNAVDFGKKGVITTHANIHAGVDYCTKLTDKDIASQHMLAAKTLDSPSLPCTVATVA